MTEAAVCRGSAPPVSRSNAATPLPSRVGHPLMCAVHVPTRREGQYAIPTACLTVAGSSSAASMAWATSAREIA